MTEVIVTIKQGQLLGIIDTDLDGGIFYKFLGIPYAKSPVGSLRFKAPQPPECWIGVRDCTVEANDCLSANRGLPQEVSGSEDCLYLNVFTKQVKEPASVPKPVMVYIHGGAFIVGSSSESLHGANHLLTEDIVLVTINYRLGILGFLSSDNSSLKIPGNAGLKDQVMALKWVQENILKFNGDPTNVTIFGDSAGGASVQFLMLSPSASGLFHKAISQSGSALNPWAWGSKNLIEVAQKMGINSSSEEAALNTLMNMPADELVKASFQMEDQIVNAHIRRPFGPVIEKPNPTAFLTENPEYLLFSGKYNQVPLILGCVSAEGLIYDYAYTGDKFNLTLGDEVPWNLNFLKNTEEYSKVTKLISDFYFKNGRDKENIYKFIGDVNFIYGIIKSTKLIVKSSSKPVYLYVYSNLNDLSDMVRKLFDIPEDSMPGGVGHGGDDMVLFKSALINALGVDMEEPENRDAVKTIVKLWTNFAQSGTPDEQWKPVTNENNLKYFEINKEVKLKTNPFANSVAFWESISKDAPCNTNNISLISKL